MKNKKTSVAGFIFTFIYLFTVLGFLFSLKREDTVGKESAQNRFTILTRETSQNLNKNDISSEEFINSFLDSLGNLSDIAGIQLKYDNNLIFSYPAEIANGAIVKSSHVSSYSTNINTRDNSSLTLTTAIYRLKPEVIYRNLKIAFLVILATTLICLSYFIYVNLYDKDKSENSDSDFHEPEFQESEEDSEEDLNEDNDEIYEEETEEESDLENSETQEYELEQNEDKYLLPEEESEELKEDLAETDTTAEEYQEKQEETVEEEYDDEEDIFSEEEDFTLGDDDDMFLDDEEEDSKEEINHEDDDSRQEDDTYSKIQISPAEYTALKEAMDETQAELEAQKNANTNDSISDQEEDDDDDLFSDFEVNEEVATEESEEELVQQNISEEETDKIVAKHPNGLFSEKTGFGWESYMLTRLDSELVRAASSEQDLSLFTIRIQDLTWFSEAGKEIAEFIKTIVNFPDLIFEYETDGCTAILPNTHIDQSLKTADDLYTGITEILQEYGFSNKIGIGISAKSLRMISGDRLANESQEALKHAFQDETSPIVAFKVNPQKYRSFLAAQSEEAQQ